MSEVIPCERCNGSGEIAVRPTLLPNVREVPGPVPDDARGWAAMTCPACKGISAIEIDDEEL